MGIFKKVEDKIHGEIDEITCDKCGNTLKNYKESKGEIRALPL